MSDVYQALNDINWLSQRLKGLIALSEDIKTYDTLKDQSTEMARSVEVARQELADLTKKQEEAKRSVKQLLDQNAAIAADYKSRGDKLIQDSRLAADDLLQNLKSDVFNRQQEEEAKLSMVKNKVLEFEGQLKDLQNQINQYTNKRDSILQELDAVKNRI